MPSAAHEAYEVAEASRDASGEFDWALYEAEYERRLAERHQRLTTDARAAWRAMDGWSTVKTREEWEQAVADASERSQRGAFLIDQLGAEPQLDPTRVPVLV